MTIMGLHHTFRTQLDNGRHSLCQCQYRATARFLVDGMDKGIEGRVFMLSHLGQHQSFMKPDDCSRSSNLNYRADSLALLTSMGVQPGHPVPR